MRAGIATRRGAGGASRAPRIDVAFHRIAAGARRKQDVWATGVGASETTLLRLAARTTACDHPGPDRPPAGQRRGWPTGESVHDRSTDSKAELVGDRPSRKVGRRGPVL